MSDTCPSCGAVLTVTNPGGWINYHIEDGIFCRERQLAAVKTKYSEAMTEFENICLALPPSPETDVATAVGNLVRERDDLKAERYLPLDCPICGRGRLCYWPKKNECKCDKCGYSTEAAARDAKENSDG